MEASMKVTIPAALVAALVLASPAALAQTANTGSTSAPGASVAKDDQTYKPMQSKKHVAKHTRHQTKAMNSKAQTTGSGSSSSSGASVNKDDTKAKTKY